LLTLVVGRLDDLLNREIGSVDSLIPQQFADDFDSMVRVAGRQLARFLSGLLDRREVADAVRWQFYALGNNFLARPLERAMHGDRRAGFFDFLEQQLHSLLSSPNLERRLKLAIREKVDGLLTEEKSLRDLLPSSLIELSHRLLEREAPHLLAKAADFLAEPDMRDRMIRTVCQGIDHFIVSLGPLAALAANFVNGEAIERKVREYLDSSQDDIRQWLLNSEVQQRLTVLLKERLDQFLATPLVVLLQNLGDEKREEVCTIIAEQLATILARPSTAAACRNVVERYAENRCDHTLEELLQELLGKQGSRQTMEKTVETLLALLHSRDARKMADRLGRFLLEDLRHRPIGRLSALVPSRVRNGAGAALTDYVGEILVQEVPMLMETLDIRQVVADKVNSLDLMRLEELLLSIMEEQFKYINLFGALLGFLIGCLNLFFLRFF